MVTDVEIVKEIKVENIKHIFSRAEVIGALKQFFELYYFT